MEERTPVVVSEAMRAVRKQRGYTLKDVDEKSNGKFKHMTIGSYERGHRSISVAKAVELAEFYDVPLAVLLGIQVQPLQFEIDRLTNIISALREMSNA